MKKHVCPEATQNEPHRRSSPTPARQLECVTGGIRGHIIGGGLDDPADSNPDAP